MKDLFKTITVATFVLLRQDIIAQGTFQNLDFESTTLSPTDGSQYVSFSTALPDWNAYLGTTQQTQVYQNGFTTGAASIDIFGPNYPEAGVQGGGMPGIIDGNYTVMLQSSPPDGPGSGNAEIEQNGIIPSSAESIQWKAWDWGPPAVLTVSFSGNTLSPVVLGSGANYTLYGADISAFAGQSGDLVFASLFGGPGSSWIELDDINFSPTSVTPEPNTVVLLLMSGAAFGARLRRRKCP